MQVTFDPMSPEETALIMRLLSAEETALIMRRLSAAEPQAEEPQAEEPQAEEPQAEEPQAEEPQAEPVTRDTVRAALMSLGDRAKGIAILAKFGAKSLAAIKDEQFPAVLQAVAEAV